MTQQAPPPPAPPSPGRSLLSAQDRTDLAQSVRETQAAAAQTVRDGQATAQETQQIVADAQGEAGQGAAAIALHRASPGGNTSVVRDAGGRIVVTGPNGKTITIDPKAGLDGDQIQAMVQTALQPAGPELRGNEGPGPGAVMIVAIVFGFLFLIALVIARTVRRRPLPAGASAAVLPAETVARLARIEQAVEAVAIEVERISEAQRYSAQLLTERLAPAGPALGARTAEAPALGGQAVRG